MKQRLCCVLPVVVLFCGVLGACSQQVKQQAGAPATPATTATTGAGEAALPAGIDRSPRQTHLRMRFTPGDSFGYAISVRQRITLTRDTMNDVNAQDISYRYTFRVLDTLADGSGKLEATCVQVAFHGDYKSAGQTRTLDYNSREKNDEGKNKLFAEYNAPLNTPFTMTVSPQGTITSVTDVDKILRRLMGADYATTKMEAKQQLARTLADVTLKSILQMAFQKFENRPVTIDSAWTITQDEKLGYLAIRNHAAYALKGFTNDGQGEQAHIGIRITTTYSGNKKVDTGQGMATLNAFDINGTGTTVFDMASGRPARRSYKQNIFVKFFVEPPEELKKLAPDQAKDFWMTQKGVVENTVERF